MLDLTHLNIAQRKAVKHQSGPLLIVAGAGTGKTTVLINRLAYLVLEKGLKTDDVLLLTFTEKAAAEIEARAEQILPYGYLDLWVNTFHSFGERVLREFALDIGLNASFKLLSKTEQWILVKKNLERFKLDYYRPLANPTKFISELLRHFSRLKDENISPAEYLSYASKLNVGTNYKLSGKKKEKSDKNNKLDIGDEMEINRIKELAEAYNVYNQLLLENDSLDFGDLIIYTLKLWQKRPNILQFYREKFKHIMVDEFQDTNYAQYQLIKLLVAPHNNLVVVGDDDQAIYKFRGASLSNIMKFKDDYPQAKEVVLKENYRSRQEILDHAYSFIKHNNPNRLEVKLKIDKSLLAKNKNFKSLDSKAAVRFFNFDSEAEELAFVVQEIQELKSVDKEASWSDFAILIRANNTADAYVKELNRKNIPYQFVSWRGLYYKPIILDILAYFRLLDNYHESSALFRVLNMNIFKVEHADLININKKAQRKLWSSYEALKNVNSIPGISALSVKNIKKLLSLLDQHSLLVAKLKPSQIFLRFAYDSGFLAELDRDRDLELFSYLNQFYQKIKRMEEAEPDLKLKDFLSSLNLELEAGETGSLKLDFVDEEAVKIMTVHGAKGLEFKYVFIVSLVDKRFPTISRSEKISIPDDLIKERIIIDESNQAAVHLEEERRLFYVALTRAKDRLYLIASKDYGGAREKKPSRFLAEMNLSSELKPELDLSEKNEFLRDIHYLNKRELKFEEKTKKYVLPSRFSFSQLAAYSTCPLQYKYAFILKVPVAGDKSSLIFGRSLHNTLYNFLLPVLAERQKIQANLFSGLNKEDKGSNKIKSSAQLLNEKRLLELYEEFWQNDGYRSKKDREEYRLKGRIALKNFLFDYLENPPQEILFLEKRFSFRLGQDIIKGAIDRVDRLADGSLEIIDYKTGKTKEKLSFKDKRQLILYQLFLEEFLGEKVGQLSFYYLETSNKVSFVASAKDISKLRLELANEIAAIKKHNFNPNPSVMCQYCDFKNICEFRQS